MEGRDARALTSDNSSTFNATGKNVIREVGSSSNLMPNLPQVNKMERETQNSLGPIINAPHNLTTQLGAGSSGRQVKREISEACVNDHEHARKRQVTQHSNFPVVNKENQEKIQEQHAQILNLQAKVERLTEENKAYRDNLNYAPSNRGPTPQQGIRIGGSNGSGQPGIQARHRASESARGTNFVNPHGRKPAIFEVATTAMNELITVADMGTPMWMASPDCNREAINENEYDRIFQLGTSTRSADWTYESSRASTFVQLNQIGFINVLMNVEKWPNLFSRIVTNVVLVEVICNESNNNHDGTLQMLTTRLHVPSPIAPVYDTKLIRYCKQYAQEAWAVVDVSTDHIFPTPGGTRCVKMPSGCLVQKALNGYSKVTWVEHLKVNNTGVHNLCRPLLNSGIPFGAQRWISVIRQQCERNASIEKILNPISYVGVFKSPAHRWSLWRLAHRMVQIYYAGVSGSAHSWRTLSGTGFDTDVKIRSRQSTMDPGCYPGVVISATSSCWIPLSTRRVFDFFCNVDSRNQWDVLSVGANFEVLDYIGSGQNSENRISLLRLNSSDTRQPNMLVLQDSCTDSSGSHVIFAPLDMSQIYALLSGVNPDHLHLLPSGFSILPNGNKRQGNFPGEAGCSGSILTIAFQLLADSNPVAAPSAKSIAYISKLYALTTEMVKGSLF